MAGVFWYLFSAGGATAALLACGLWVGLSRGSQASRRALAIAAAFFTLAGSYVIPWNVSRVVSYGYRQLQRDDVPPGTVTIVVLGSGSVQVRNWAEDTLTVPDYISASRLLEGARLFRMLGAARIISSGGAATPQDRFRPSGQVMANTLVSLGIPREQILIETESTNTHDEALIVRAMLAEHPTDHVVLVTSRVHMRRSVGTFRAAGIAVIPSIARDPVSVETLWEMLVPTDKGLREAALTAHEVLGLAAYGVRGWYRF